MNDGHLSPTPVDKCGGSRRGFTAKWQNSRWHGVAAAASPYAIGIRETTVEGDDVRFASELQNPRWHGAAAVAAPCEVSIYRERMVRTAVAFRS